MRTLQERERADCTVQATAAALGIPYEDAHARLAKLGRKNHCRFCFWRAAEALGLKERPEFSCRRLGKVLSELKEEGGTYVVRIRRHVFAVVNGETLEPWQTPGRHVLMVYEKKLLKGSGRPPIV